MAARFMTPARKWLGISAIAIAAATVGAAGLMQTPATAQVSIQPSIQDGFADLVDAVRPAVVSITVDGLAQAPQSFGNGPNFEFDFPDLPEDHPFRKFFDNFGDGQGGEGSRQQRPRRFAAAGSGFVISKDGYVVTNNHVVAEAENVTVVADNGSEYPATIVGTDSRTDLALLKIDGVDDLKFVEFTDDAARVGDWVVAMGNPFGLGGTVTAGIVSASGRDIGGNSYGDFLQIDAAVNRGNSGGPTFNLSGEVVGVNTAIFSPNGGSVGIAFAIPAATVERIIDQLKSTGSVTRGFLGVSIQDLSKDIADSVGLPTARGALVTEPREGTPAANAGIKSGDVIVEVDGDPIDNALDLSRTIASKQPGSTVMLTIWRDQSTMDVSVTLTELTEEEPELPAAPPEEAAPDPAPTSVGLVLVPNAEGDGLLVQDIEPDSLAAEKGLQVGDIILEADNKPVSSADAFEAAVDGVTSSDRSTILIKASRNGNVRFIGLPLESE